MTSTTHRPESTAAALYVACELSAKEWLLTMSTAPDAKRQRARVRPGDRAALERVLADAQTARFGLAADAPVRSCYEAGRDGFWPHRFLTTLGVSESGRGLLEHRGAAAGAAGEDGSAGRREAAPAAAAALGRRTGHVAGGARARRARRRMRGTRVAG